MGTQGDVRGGRESSPERSKASASQVCPASCRVKLIQCVRQLCIKDLCCVVFWDLRGMLRPQSKTEPSASGAHSVAREVRQ